MEILLYLSGKYGIHEQLLYLDEKWEFLRMTDNVSFSSFKVTINLHQSLPLVGLCINP